MILAATVDLEADLLGFWYVPSGGYSMKLQEIVKVPEETTAYERNFEWRGLHKRVTLHGDGTIQMVISGNPVHPIMQDLPDSTRHVFSHECQLAPSEKESLLEAFVRLPFEVMPESWDSWDGMSAQYATPQILEWNGLYRLGTESPRQAPGVFSWTRNAQRGAIFRFSDSVEREIAVLFERVELEILRSAKESSAGGLPSPDWRICYFSPPFSPYSDLENRIRTREFVIEHQPVYNSTAGAHLQLFVTIHAPRDIQRVCFHVRHNSETGFAVFYAEPLDESPEGRRAYSVNLGGNSHVHPPGLEYYVTATDGAETLSLPRGNPEEMATAAGRGLPFPPGIAASTIRTVVQ